MLYGQIESLEDRVDHLIRLRESQKRSPGFNAFIPLAFHPDGNEMNDCGWTTGLDDIRMFAVARLMLDNFDHIKAYWMIQGIKVCQVALEFGADDMDGTHGSTDEELIYHSAGTSSGVCRRSRFRRLIEAGYSHRQLDHTIPARRTPPAWRGLSVELRSGRIGAPAICDLCRRRGMIAYPGSLHADVPSRLNSMLVDGAPTEPTSAYAAKPARPPDFCASARRGDLGCSCLSVPPALLTASRIYVTKNGQQPLRILNAAMASPVYIETDSADRERPGGARRVLLISDKRSR